MEKWENMPRIVNYAKKKCLSKRAMCLAFFPRWSSVFWPRPSQTEIFLEAPSGVWLFHLICDRMLLVLRVTFLLLRQRRFWDACCVIPGYRLFPALYTGEISVENIAADACSWLTGSHAVGGPPNPLFVC